MSVAAASSCASSFVSDGPGSTWSSFLYSAGSFSNSSVYTVLTEASSCVTSSDVIGTGRTIGRFYSKLGRALENSLSRYSERNGNGPRVIMQKIEQVVLSLRDPSALSTPSVEKSSDVKKRREELIASCRKLLRYIQSNVVTNQLDAIHAIIFLSTTYPLLQDFFQECSSSIILSTFLHRLTTQPYTSASRDEFNQLISSTRFALLLISYSAINDAIKNLFNSVKASSLVIDIGTPLSVVFVAAHEDSDSSHVARLYLKNWLRRLSNCWQVRSLQSTCDLFGKVVRVVSDEADGGIITYDEITLTRMICAVHILVTSSSEVVDLVALDAICFILLRFHGQCTAVDLDWEFGALLSDLRRESIRHMLPQSSELADRFFMLPQGLGPTIVIDSAEECEPLIPIIPTDGLLSVPTKYSSRY